MTTLKIALLQIAPTGTLEGNLEKGIAACRRAKQQGADIALFPEMFSCGYDICDRPPSVWQADAVAADDPFVTRFGELAKELDLAIAVTFLEAYAPAPRNSMVLFDRHGEQVLTYAKVHTCDFGAEQHLTAGDRFTVVSLDTAAGKVQVGAMICYDREFPESARLLMLDGAELILVPNACPMEINRLSQLRARAYENMLALATCNYPIDVPDCNGGSSVFDGVAYLPALSGSRDTCLLLAGEEEGVFVAELDLDMLRAYRESEVHGNAYRRPPIYQRLLDTDIRPPFIRADRKQGVMMSDRIEKALAFAARKHEGQFRKGGKPYITHPMTVCDYVRAWGCDEDTQITALFHDLLEDTDATEAEIAMLGGEAVLCAVKRLTKQNGYRMSEYMADILQNPMAKTVKIADRLHNLRSAVEADESFRQRYILESIEWYAPLSDEIVKAVKELAATMPDFEKGLPAAYRNI